MHPSSTVRYQRVILALVLLAQFVTPLVIASVWALAPLLRDSLNLTREQIGSLTALFFVGTVVTGIPVGWLAEWGAERRRARFQRLEDLWDAQHEQVWTPTAYSYRDFVIKQSGPELSFAIYGHLALS